MLRWRVGTGLPKTVTKSRPKHKMLVMTKPIPFDEMVNWIKKTGNRKCIDMWGYSNHFWVTCPDNNHINIAGDGNNVVNVFDEHYWNAERLVMQNAIDNQVIINTKLQFNNRIYGPNVIAMCRSFLEEEALCYIKPLCRLGEGDNAYFNVIKEELKKTPRIIYSLGYQNQVYCLGQVDCIEIREGYINHQCTEDVWNTICKILRRKLINRDDVFDVVEYNQVVPFGEYIPAICRTYLKSLL